MRRIVERDEEIESESEEKVVGEDRDDRKRGISRREMTKIDSRKFLKGIRRRLRS